jgi:N4-gp56 family major capsid protein
MATQTLSTLPAGTQAFYNRNLLERAVPADIHGRFGQMRSLKQRNGNQQKFRRYNVLPPALTPLTEGVTPADSNVSITEVTATLAQYGAYIPVSDMVQLVNQDPILTEFGQVLGEQAGTTIDQIRRDVLVTGTNVVYGNGVSRAAVNTSITETMVRSAVRFLKRQNGKKVKKMNIAASTGVGTQPIRAAYIGFIHPDTEATLKALPNWIPIQKYAQQMDIMEDEVGSLDEVRFIMSTNAKIFANAGAVGGTNVISTGGTLADIYATIIIAEDAYGVVPLSGEAMHNIVKGNGSAGTADPLDQRATTGWKATTTTIILQDLWMTRLEHANTNNL